MLSQISLPELDGVRGIACGLVVVMHCLIGISTVGVELRRVVFPLFVAGVDLFFVLSGFLIVGILIDNREAKNYFPAFWARRILRIFPVYFLLLFTYAVASAIHARFQITALDVWLFKYPELPIWSYALFVQNYFMAFQNNTGSYWLGVTWSLSIEEQFYLVVPLLAFILNRRQMLMLALACIVIAPALRLWPGADWHWYYFATPCRMDALMFGVAVTCAIRDEAIMAFFRRWRFTFDVAAVALALLDMDGLVISMTPQLRYSVVAAIFAYCILRIFLVEGGWFRAVLRTRLLVQLGLISYPLYMYHQAINGLVHGLLFGKAPAVSSFSQLAASLLVMSTAAVLATISTRYFERPFRQRGKRIKYSFEPASRTGAIQAASTGS